MDIYNNKIIFLNLKSRYKNSTAKSARKTLDLSFTTPHATSSVPYTSSASHTTSSVPNTTSSVPNTTSSVPHKTFKKPNSSRIHPNIKGLINVFEPKNKDPNTTKIKTKQTHKSSQQTSTKTRKTSTQQPDPSRKTRKTSTQQPDPNRKTHKSSQQTSTKTHKSSQQTSTKTHKSSRHVGNNNNFVFDPQQAAFCGGHAINNLLQKICVTYGTGKLNKYVNNLLNLDYVANKVYHESLQLADNFTQNDFYDSNGNYNIEVLIAAINEFKEYNALNISDYYNLISYVINSETSHINEKLVGFIINMNNHYFAVRIKPFKKNTPNKCSLDLNLNLDLNDYNNIANLRVAVIDSINDKCRFKNLDCKTLGDIMEELFDVNTMKRDVGCICVLEK